nr:Chain A, Zinc finger protein 473 [Homo sapiens]
GSSGSSGHTRKRYECSKCQATFNLRKHLIQHQKTHAAKSGPSSG